MKNILMTLHDNKALFLWLLLGGFLLLGFTLRLEALEVVRLNQWLTRDIDRAFNLFDGNYFPLAGPETTNGLRLPGPFLYVLMAIPLWFHYSYESIFNFYFLLNFSSLVLSFYVVKKYFGFNTASLTTILQSTHLLYIEAITFPINPAFLLILIPFLLWSILEFTINKNEKALPFLALIVALGVQIHLSIATFLLIPIISGIVFKIRVSSKTVLKTLLICLICFFPFIFYLNHSYKPDLSITHVTKFDPFLSFLEPFRILTVQNTINRLGDFSIGQGNLTNFAGVSNIYTNTQLILMNGSFLGLLLITFGKIKKKGLQNSKKEAIPILIFYCPALIYDLIRPWELHFWYNYIFILPMALLISKFLNQFQFLFKSTSLKIISQLVVYFIIIYLSFYNVTNFRESKRIVQNSSQIGNYHNFQGLKFFYLNWSKKINLPIEEFHENTFIEGIQSPSPNLFKLSSTNKDLVFEKVINAKPTKCVYIIDDDYIVKNRNKFYLSGNSRLNLFLADSTLNKKPFKNFLIEDKGLLKLSKFRYFRFYEYEPKFNQPCYQNPSNTFPSSLRDEKLLEDYYQFQKFGDNILEKNIETGLSEELKALNLKYIYNDDQIKYPIRFQINIKKVVDGYDLNFIIDSYSWGIDSADQFIYKELSFLIVKGNSIEKTNNPKKFELISKNSFVSHGFGINQEKFNWYRNYKLRKDYEFPKDSFVIKVSGKLGFINREEPEERDLNILIPVELKS
jgi:hypothetical protein